MRPQSILGVVRGFARDLALDALPKGTVWDLKDLVVERRGVRLESRGAWGYHTPSALPDNPLGGRFTRYAAGDKLNVVANGNIYDIDITSGAQTLIGALFASVIQNGVKLRDRVYFMDGAGAAPPKAVTYTGSYAITSCGSGAPNAKVGCAYRDRLVVAAGGNVYFSKVEASGGPLGTWDPNSVIGVTSEVYGLAPMANQLLVFHAKSVDKIVGGIPPETSVDSDMSVTTLTTGVGCTMPATICSWNENVLWADERGVYLTEGATIRNLSEQGGISDFWRELYSLRSGGNSVSMSVFYDYLIVTVNIPIAPFSITLICDLQSRGWTRFTNFPASCLMPAEGLNEEVYAGHFTSNKVVKVSPMFISDSFLQPPASPKPNQVDGNGVTVLPSLETGWVRMGDEGRKQIRAIYASYEHIRSGTTPPVTADCVQVSYRVDPEPVSLTGGYVVAGKMPSVSNRYTRKRMPVGKQAFGLQVKIEAVQPFAWFRIMDLALEGSVLDRGRVSVAS